MAGRPDNILSELRAYGGFLLGLPRFLRRRVTYEEALAVLRERLQNRENNFLATVKRSVFENPRNPYYAMMEVAGCEYGDLEVSVRTRGLEATLKELKDNGVYVGFEEFKGRAPIIRGGREIPNGPHAFDNPRITNYYSVTTGGSSGAGRRVLLDLTYLRSLMISRIVSRNIQGTAGIPSASWGDLPPGGGLTSAMMSIPMGSSDYKWFVATGGRGSGQSIRFQLATYTALSLARMLGHKTPWPEHLPLDHPEVLALWARDRLRESGACTIHGSVSRILRIAVAAHELGIDLTGAILRGGGEPPTEAKVAQITRTGATFRSSYAFTEVGSVGSCCLNPKGPNDQHFMRDHLAMIQAPLQVPGFDVEVPAFFYTTLLDTNPKMLINVGSDDYGVVETRTCGCPWEALGFPEHISDIRSYKKLTGEGVTLVGSDIEKILEELLPARFGGSALDYQLMEEEDEKGFTRLTLLVHPRLTLADEQGPARALLEALGNTDAGTATARSIWRQAGTIRVRREVPRVTSRGKLMPLQLAKRVAGAQKPAEPAAPVGV